MYSAYLSSCHSSDCQPEARAGNQKSPPEIVDINTVSGMSSNTSIKDMDIPGYVKMVNTFQCCVIFHVFYFMFALICVKLTKCTL